MSRSSQGAPNGRRSGPVVDRVRALRARELLGRGHRTPTSDTAPMPEPGREWPFILAELKRRAQGKDPRSGENAADPAAE